jgi:CBS domain-containing membrane protein
MPCRVAALHDLGMPDPDNNADRSPAALTVAWLRALWPAPIAVDWNERTRVTVGAGLGLLLTGWLCQLMAAGSAGAWLVAPLGASAVLVFAVPTSPMAQPWPVVGGNTVSALVGILCVRWIGPPELAAAVAVAAAIGLMFVLRCLHPPGGASALLVVLGGVTDPQFALFPVFANSLLLALAGIAYNNATRRAYPHVAPLPAAASARDAEADALDADLDAVLARYNQVLDINRDDLKALIEDTHLRAYQRRLANIRCRDIMSRDLITVSRHTPPAQAWALFAQHRIKALPVVDAAGGIVGIVTPADFTRQDAAAKPETIGQIMTRKVQVARVDRHLAELVPLFGGSGHHHIPIVGDQGRLVGIITQTDLVAALSGVVKAP